MEFSSLVNPPYNPSGSQTTSRFSGAEWFNFVTNTDVTVIGVGGIGSWLAFMLSRLNPRTLTLVDGDTVEAANLSGQLFRSEDCGNSKVSAINQVIRQFSNYYKVNTFHHRFAQDSATPDVVLCGFDNMEARRTVYNKWKLKVRRNPSRAKDFLYIDGRLSAETLQVFCITGDAPYYMEQYEQDWLFSDEEAESTVCSYKQTSYCANLIASLMTNLFVNWCTNQCNPLVDRALPFMTEYAAEQFYLKTEV